MINSIKLNKSKRTAAMPEPKSGALPFFHTSIILQNG
uniref:Uncharacterized protein n=1 Tax=Myoviridae sp. ctgEf1 TaxID=2827699 RepID=A0A8S5SL10_9CAUD|nr:MAG TPA: hypothetical protein [Myoviridae sp. ctgEf1]DAS17465.1 MAG TPA: hypothetical protein [Caudoviricetes sp.]